MEHRHCTIEDSTPSLAPSADSAASRPSTLDTPPRVMNCCRKPASCRRAVAPWHSAKTRCDPSLAVRFALLTSVAISEMSLSEACASAMEQRGDGRALRTRLF